MFLLTPETLAKRVDRLRAQGVSFPRRYPPLNLEPHTGWFRGVVGVVEAVELLARSFARGSVSVEPPRLRGSVPGADVDIDIRSEKHYRMQVKTLLPETARFVDSRVPLLSTVTGIRRDALRRFCDDWGPSSTFSHVQIHPDSKGRPVYSGYTHEVAHPNSVHVALTEVASAITTSAVERRIGQRIRESVHQLRNCDKGILAPVINLARAPHNQAKIFQHVECLLRRERKWNRVGGVLLVVAGFGARNRWTGFHRQHLRLLVVENPNASLGFRLDPDVFSPRQDEELLYDQSLMAIGVDPPGSALRIRQGSVRVGDALFGFLPEHTAQPSLTRVW